MLLNDITRNDKMNGVHTRDLQNAVVRHHKNNPHVSREAAFEYIMSISSTYRALPVECTNKARKYLALPLDKKSIGSIDISERIISLFFGPQDKITPIVWEHTASPTDDLKEALKTTTKVPYGHIPLNGPQTVDYLVGLTNELASQVVHRGSSKGYIFNCALGKLSKLKTVCIVDVIKARKRLGLSTRLIKSVTQCINTTHQKKPIKPDITVVHAERVVVDDKKMIKILEFENVAYMKDLPDEYLSEAPTFYKCNPPRNIKANVMFHEQIDSSNTLSYSISHDNIMSIKEFGQMIKTMKEASARLTKINKTAKLEKEHSGKFTVSI